MKHEELLTEAVQSLRELRERAAEMHRLADTLLWRCVIGDLRADSERQPDHRQPSRQGDLGHPSLLRNDLHEAIERTLEQATLSEQIDEDSFPVRLVEALSSGHVNEGRREIERLAYELAAVAEDVVRNQEAEPDSSGHPRQPTYVDEDGVERFRENSLVRFLLDVGPHDLNSLAKVPASLADRRQLAQLIGYSVVGYHDLSYSEGNEDAKN